MRADPTVLPWWGVAGFGAAVGLFGGAMVVDPEAHLAATLVLLALGGATMVGTAGAGFVARARRYLQLVRSVEAASTEVVSGAVEATPVVAQLMRWRTRYGGPAFLAGTPFPIATPPMLVLATLPSDDGPRWVAGLAPVLQPGVRYRQAAGFLLHPTEPVVVLDPRITPAYVAATSNDPRWARGVDWSRAFVAGAAGAVGSLVGGVAAGAVVALLVVLVL